MIKRWKDDKFRAKVIKGMFWAWKLHYLISLRSRAHVNVSTFLEHMDVRAGLQEYWKRLTPEEKEERLDKQRAGGFQDGRLVSAGLNDHHASPAGAVTRDKISDGASRRSI